MSRKEYIKQYYGSGRGCNAMLQPIEDDYGADSFPGQAKHKEMEFSLIITDPKDEARRNGEVRIIKEGNR